MEVERIAEEFRKLHQERQDLLDQWEQSITSMRQRDQEIFDAQERYQMLKVSSAFHVITTIPEMHSHKASFLFKNTVIYTFRQKTRKNKLS
jgi:hypothetical protein